SVVGDQVRALFPDSIPVGLCQVQLDVTYDNPAAKVATTLPELAADAATTAPPFETSDWITIEPSGHDLLYSVVSDRTDPAGHEQTYVVAMDPESGKLVKKIGLGYVGVSGSSQPLVRTPDGTQVYIATTKGIYVVDAVVPRLLNGDPSSTGPNPLP